MSGVPVQVSYTAAPSGNASRRSNTTVTPLGPGESYFRVPGTPAGNSSVAGLTAQFRAFGMGSSRKSRKNRKSRRSRKSRR
jgi:hypothetical protein